MICSLTLNTGRCVRFFTYRLFLLGFWLFKVNKCDILCYFLLHAFAAVSYAEQAFSWGDVAQSRQDAEQENQIYSSDLPYSSYCSKKVWKRLNWPWKDGFTWNELPRLSNSSPLTSTWSSCSWEQNGLMGKQALTPIWWFLVIGEKQTVSQWGAVTSALQIPSLRPVPTDAHQV